jgi:hypothetical protein
MKKITFLLAVLLLASSAVLLAQPTVSAPTPTAGASSVISIFSNAYTNVAGTQFFPNWGQATTYQAIQIGGTDDVIKYANMNYQGIQFGSAQDVSTMKYLHIDVWTADANAATFPITLIWGAEITIKKTIATNGTWTSLDIPLTEFTGANLANVIQFKFQSDEWAVKGAASDPSKHTTIYLDNLYFWTDVVPSVTVSTSTLTIDQAANSTKTFDITTSGSWTVSSNETWLTPSSTSGTGNATITLTATANSTYNNRQAEVSVSGSGTTRKIAVTQSSLVPAPAAVPTHNAANVISVYSDSYTNLPTILQNWHGNTFSNVTVNGNEMLKNSSICCFGYEFVTKPQNVSTMTKLHVDIFPVSLPSLTIGLVGGGEFKKMNIPVVANQWNSIDISLSELTGANLANVNQVGFWDLNGTFFMDNLYFYNETATGINSAEKSLLISMFPNPATEKLTIAAQSSIKEILVRNLVGQTVVKTMANGLEQSVDLSSIEAGNYLVTVLFSNGQQTTQKFVKQ